MSVVVTIPEGLFPGDEMAVTAGDQEFVVLVPPGCAPGSDLEVTLPEQPDENRFMDVDLPPGCQPGDELTVHVDGVGPITFRVPEDCASPTRIEIPRMEGSASGQAEQSAEPPPESPAKRDLGSGAHRVYEEPKGVEWVGSNGFFIGLGVEVLRTDGRRTFGTIESTDYLSGTYSVRMTNGQMKYMVEEEDLKHYRAGSYDTGDLVIVKGCAHIRDGKMCEARIAGFDEYENAYSVRIKDGQIVPSVLPRCLQLHPDNLTRRYA